MLGHQGHGCTGQFFFRMQTHTRKKRIIRSRDRAKELAVCSLGRDSITVPLFLSRHLECNCHCFDVHQSMRPLSRHTGAFMA